MTIQNNQNDFQAVIRVTKTEDGGRKTGIFSGYFPLMNFDGKHLDGGKITLLEKEIVKPGEEVIAEVKLIAIATWHKENIWIGKEFIVQEGRRIVAKGEITEIYSNELKNESLC